MSLFRRRCMFFGWSDSLSAVRRRRKGQGALALRKGQEKLLAGRLVLLVPTMLATGPTT